VPLQLVHYRSQNHQSLFLLFLLLEIYLGFQELDQFLLWEALHLRRLNFALALAKEYMHLLALHLTRVRIAHQNIQ